MALYRSAGVYRIPPAGFTLRHDGQWVDPGLLCSDVARSMGLFSSAPIRVDPSTSTDKARWVANASAREPTFSARHTSACYLPNKARNTLQLNLFAPGSSTPCAVAFTRVDQPGSVVGGTPALPTAATAFYEGAIKTNAQGRVSIVTTLLHASGAVAAAATPRVEEVLHTQQAVSGLLLLELRWFDSDVGTRVAPGPVGHSKYHGVSPDRAANRWRAMIWDPAQKKKIPCGTHDTEVEAARAVDAAIIRLG